MAMSATPSTLSPPQHQQHHRLLLSPSPSSLSPPSSTSFTSRATHSLSSTTIRYPLSAAKPKRGHSTTVYGSLHALIFDCDGVILESEDLHRQAYNDAFAFFNVRCPADVDGSLNWDVEFYDVLQNRIGGGKPKMRWYFKENGWPTSTVFETPPENDADRAKLIDTLQDWKTERYQEIIKSGSVQPRPGVLQLMDEAKAAGKKLAVCSAATKSSVILTLESLIGLDRFHGLDCFLAGDDVKEKKPDPSIYITAAQRLGVSEKDCLVVEDSIIGLQAATKAGMSCVVTYTPSTSNQDFSEAIAIYPDLSSIRLSDLEMVLENVVAAG
ncbi:haloacid dehalogenase-like hydrolase domain-containing protein At4g39970 [Silene latifolia]|uniref:haloacid dehalogenase-like hydrolase domain-containing protein At4g39970 n=1 Tax=Silene latifolia TaxID=37657 RepID=UPI003D774112